MSTEARATNGDEPAREQLAAIPGASTGASTGATAAAEASPATAEPAAGSEAPEGANQGPGTARAAETLLTLAEAARTVGLSERALRKHIQRGRLQSRTLVRNGRTIAAVELETLKRTYGALQMVPTATVNVAGEGGARGTRLRSRVELDLRKRLKELLGVRRDLEGRLGKLKALLGMERTQKRELQRQLQFMADSLARHEQQLEASRVEVRDLTLEVGVARGRAEELTRQLESAKTQSVESSSGATQATAGAASNASLARGVRPVEDDDAPLPVPSRGGVRT